MGWVGGYKLVDFKERNLITDGEPVLISGIYKRCTSLFVKRFIAVGLRIDGQYYAETDLSIHEDASHNFIADVGTKTLTITPLNMVSVSDSSSGAAWGEITGNIENQEDLAEELDLIYEAIDLKQNEIPEITVTAEQFLDTDTIQFTDAQAAIIENVDNTVYKFTLPGNNTYCANKSTGGIAATYLFSYVGNLTDITMYYYSATKQGDMNLKELATVEDLEEKQDELTAGANISIVNNVISATVPAGSGTFTAYFRKVNNVWTCDKTYAEIVAEINADKPVIAVVYTSSDRSYVGKILYLSATNEIQVTYGDYLNTGTAMSRGALTENEYRLKLSSSDVITNDIVTSYTYTLESTTGTSTSTGMTQKAITDALGNKQNTLTAGSNITISGNTISASGYGQDKLPMQQIVVTCSPEDWVGHYVTKSPALLTADCYAAVFTCEVLNVQKISQYTLSISNFDPVQGTITIGASTVPSETLNLIIMLFYKI